MHRDETDDASLLEQAHKQSYADHTEHNTPLTMTHSALNAHSNEMRVLVLTHVGNISPTKTFATQSTCMFEICLAHAILLQIIVVAEYGFACTFTRRNLRWDSKPRTVVALVRHVAVTQIWPNRKLAFVSLLGDNPWKGNTRLTVRASKEPRHRLQKDEL